MTISKLKIDSINPNFWVIGRINSAQVDATTDEEILQQQSIDDTEVIQEVAKFVLRVRRAWA